VGHQRTGCIASRAETGEARPIQEASQRMSIMNTPTKIGIGAYFVISLAFDLFSGHLSFLRDIVIAFSVALVIRLAMVLAKAISD
jgi:hypothetical protein